MEGRTQADDERILGIEDGDAFPIDLPAGLQYGYGRVGRGRGRGIVGIIQGLNVNRLKDDEQVVVYLVTIRCFSFIRGRHTTTYFETQLRGQLHQGKQPLCPNGGGGSWVDRHGLYCPRSKT